MTSLRIRSDRALSGEPLELNGVLFFHANGPPAWLSSLTGLWSPGPSTRLTCRGSLGTPGTLPRPRSRKPPLTRWRPPCGKLQIGEARRVLVPSPPQPLLCSQTPPSDHTPFLVADWAERMPPRAQTRCGLALASGGPGGSWMCGSPLAASPVSADWGGGMGVQTAFSLSFVMERILSKANMP